MILTTNYHDTVLAPTPPLQCYAALIICIFRHHQVPIGLVYSIYDPTEIAIREVIEVKEYIDIIFAARLDIRSMDKHLI
jgi:hypothetical protein